MIVQDEFFCDVRHALANRDPSFLVVCPACGAQVEMPCRPLNRKPGEFKAYPHESRNLLAHETLTDRPVAPGLVYRGVLIKKPWTTQDRVNAYGRTVRFILPGTQMYSYWAFSPDERHWYAHVVRAAAYNFWKDLSIVERIAHETGDPKTLYLVQINKDTAFVSTPIEYQIDYDDYEGKDWSELQ